MDEKYGELFAHVKIFSVRFVVSTLRTHPFCPQDVNLWFTLKMLCITVQWTGHNGILEEAFQGPRVAKHGINVVYYKWHKICG